MIYPHPHEIDALHQRITALELDLQHKREIISVLLDREARAQARRLSTQERLEIALDRERRAILAATEHWIEADRVGETQ